MKKNPIEDFIGYLKSIERNTLIYGTASVLFMVFFCTSAVYQIDQDKREVIDVLKGCDAKAICQSCDFLEDKLGNYTLGRTMINLTINTTEWKKNGNGIGRN